MTATGLRAQDAYTQRAKKYIETYSQMAMAEQRQSGVPASITLGQGILETEAGASELVVNANNHFGIKCKSDWGGETYTYTDDAPNECFKKYKDAFESFHDHSLHLQRNPRYHKLFSIPITNYSGWAVGLRKAGYATNPQYAQRLIKIIKEFKLDTYTEMAINMPATPQPAPVAKEATATAAVQPVKQEVVIAKTTEPNTLKAAKPATVAPSVPQPPVTQKPGSRIVAYSSEADTAKRVAPAVAPATVADSGHASIQRETNRDYYAAVPPVDTSKVTTVNGLRAFPGRKGEMLLKYAVQYKIRYPQLLEMNDLPDAALPFDCYVYLEKKSATGVRDRHIVKDGESLLMIAQEEGIQLKRLMAFNHLNSKDEPVSGAVLELQTPATQKPEVKIALMPAHRGNAISTADAGNHSNYITLRKEKVPIPPDTPPVVAAKTSTPDKAPKPENKIKNIINKIRNADTSTLAVKTTSPTNTTPADAVTAVISEPMDMDSMESMGPFLVYLSGDKTDILTNASMQWIKAENEPPKAVEKGNAISPAALAKLKAELDPIVYADDSKLIAANPATVKAARTAVYYTVKKGETATAIAHKNNISVNDLLKWNNITAGDIKAGQELKVSE
jgi:LysM repeat protein